jgi:hypothetical protein
VTRDDSLVDPRWTPTKLSQKTETSLSPPHDKAEAEPRPLAWVPTPSLGLRSCSLPAVCVSEDEGRAERGRCWISFFPRPCPLASGDAYAVVRSGARCFGAALLLGRRSSTLNS